MRRLRSIRAQAKSKTEKAFKGCFKSGKGIVGRKNDSAGPIGKSFLEGQENKSEMPMTQKYMTSSFGNFIFLVIPLVAVILISKTVLLV